MKFADEIIFSIRRVILGTIIEYKRKDTYENIFQQLFHFSRQTYYKKLQYPQLGIALIQISHKIARKLHELCLVCGIFVHSSEASAILAEKTAISSATIAVFRESRFLTILAENIHDFSATIYGCYLPPVMKHHIFDLDGNVS